MISSDEMSQTQLDIRIKFKTTENCAAAHLLTPVMLNMILKELHQQ